MIRLIICQIETLMPHGEPLRKYRTVEIECPEVEKLLTEHAATVVGAEIVEGDQLELLRSNAHAGCALVDCPARND